MIILLSAEDMPFSRKPTSGNMMSNKPLVSVVTCFLNAEKFFAEAIESVLAQTYDNWELLLVDDGSTDSSTQIALNYADKIPDKVYYLEHEGHQNRGKSTSRNLGIHKAKGDYVAFLDADDIFLPQKLEKQVAILAEQSEAAMVCGSYYLWHSWTGNPEDVERDYGFPLVKPNTVQLDTLVKPPKLLTLFLQYKAETPTTCGVLMRRDIIEEVGGFDEAIQFLYEDALFFAKVYLKAPVFVESDCWDWYRKHPDSSSVIAEKAGEYFPSRRTLHTTRLILLNCLEKYLVEQEIEDTEVWQALKKELWPYEHPFLYRLLTLPKHLVRQMKKLIKLIGRQTLPVPIRLWLREQ